MLGNAIVIAGDRAGADIGAGPDGCIADVAQMIGLGASLDHRLLDLDEISDVNVLLQARAGTQPGEGADRGALADMRPFEMRERADHGIVLDRDPGSEYHEGLYQHLAAELSVRR